MKLELYRAACSVASPRAIDNRGFAGFPVGPFPFFIKRLFPTLLFSLANFALPGDAIVSSASFDAFLVLVLPGDLSVLSPGEVGLDFSGTS